MSGHVHYVTVTPGRADEDGWRYEEAAVKFECRGDGDSKCHSYPDCDCESWDDEHDKDHPFVKHDECWMQGWFDSEAGHVYDGPDSDDRDENCVPRDMDKSGPIVASFDIDGFVEWQFDVTPGLTAHQEGTQ